MPSQWVTQLQERASKSLPIPDHIEGYEEESSEPNSTLRYHRFRAAHEAGGGDVTPEEWIEILEWFSYRCAYCHRRVPLEMEHFVDFKNGGKHDRDNVVPACKSCNSSKKEMQYLVWLATRAAKGKRVGEQ